VELLVVILIISVLLTVGSVAIRGAAGKGVTTAVATTEALFDEARSTAMGTGTRARVLINADAGSPNYLRQVVLVGELLNPDGESFDPPQWELVGRGYTLPDGVFFSQEFSRLNHQGGAGQIPTFTLNGPRVSAAYQGNYFFYEFNGEGICTQGLSGTTYNGPSFVIGAGVMGPEDVAPRATSDAQRDFAGFVIWRNGSTSLFRNPEQILGGESQPQSF
jgi:type II secretory pathway pseudopilin PulG